MKRWAAALVAVVFLSTATLHILSHSGLTESSCVVCHMQEASLPGVPAPRAVFTPDPPVLLADVVVSRAASPRPVPGTARAPPAASA